MGSRSYVDALSAGAGSSARDARARPEPFRRCAVLSRINRRFVRDGFLAGLTAPEALLNVFLAAVADQDGLSFWGTKKIAAALKLHEGAVEAARRGLERKSLVVYRAPLHQVLARPSPPSSPAAITFPPPSVAPSPTRDGPLHVAELLRRRGLSRPAVGGGPRSAPESRRT